MSVAGIVLAGGAARRFGGGKLAAELDGRSLLERAIEATADVSEVVVLALAADGPVPTLTAQPSVAIEVVRDPYPDGGPLVGLAAGLARAQQLGAERAVVVGGDLPWMRPAVLRGLLAMLDDPVFDASEPVVDGTIRPLPSALRVGPAATAARLRLGSGGRSLAGLFDALRTAVLAESAWRAWDPDGDSFRDVDRAEDLDRPPGADPA